MTNQRTWLRFAALLSLAWLTPTGVWGDMFFQTNLVSDVPGLAPNLDPNLKNPWGVSFGPAGPFWVSDQVTGKSTLYNSLGTPQGLIVSITPQSGNPPAGPTGQVFNGSSDFKLNNGNKSAFIFSNLDGTLSGWNGGVNSEIHVLPTAPTIYTGLALANNGSANFLYAADARGGKIDVFNGSWTKTSLLGSFTDPNLPTGFVPYNAQAIGNTLYVTYENRSSGGGVVNTFDLNGNFLRRIASNSGGGVLDTPWGLAIAPVGFGSIGGDLLVGNKGNGHISAFDLNTGAFVSQLADISGTPIANTGLWGLTFGNGGNGGKANTLYFAAGINGEADGLLGSISAVPEPGSIALSGVGGLLVAAYYVRRFRSRLGN